MNPNSPGRGSVEDDIELIGVHEGAQLHQGGYHHLPTNAIAFHDEDIAQTDDDDSRALLVANGCEVRQRKSDIWSQIKDIVIEVDGFSYEETHAQRITQSAPTLLLTTISLLFTGKLLDKVSVCVPVLPSIHVL